MPIAGLLSISSIRPLVASNSRRSLVVLLSDDLLLTIGSFSAHVTSLTLAVKFQELFVTRVLDLEQKTLQPLDNPFGPKVVTHVSGTPV